MYVETGCIPSLRNAGPSGYNSKFKKTLNNISSICIISYLYIVINAMKRLLFILLIVFPIFTNGQIITTVAGDGTGSNGGNNGPATSAGIGNPTGITFDKKGNLYIVTTPSFPQVRKVDTAGIITIFAGTGTPGFSGDSGLAVNAELNYPEYVAVDSKNNVYISEGTNHRIRKVDTMGIITTFAGNGTPGFSGDSGLAISASLFAPWGINFDRNGNLFIADHANSRIRKIDTLGVITTVAGSITSGFSGDSGLAINAKLKLPSAVVIDSIGNLYIADWGNNRIRKVDTSGIITTIAGNGLAMFNGDNILDINASFSHIYSIALDDSNNLFLTDNGNARIRKINTLTDTVKTIVGTGIPGFNGDSILADTAEIYLPEGLAFDLCWNLYISEVQNKRVREVNIGICVTDTTHTDSTNAVNNISTNSSINIYPNPINEILHIDNIATGAQYFISNILGQALQQGLLSAGTNSIDVHTLPPGMYVLAITPYPLERAGLRLVKKIVKE